MNNLIEVKEQCIELRKKGLSYKEINQKLGVAKSTLSYWLRLIPLTPIHRERLYTKRIQYLSSGNQSQKHRRQREVSGIINQASKDITLPISEEAFKLMGAALYWAEGSKTASGLIITNSDPRMILFMVKWFDKVFNIHPTLLKARLNIYPQQNEEELKTFWSSLTGIPIENFGKSYIKQLSSGYKKNNLYYGTARLEVPKSTNKKHQISGWIKAVLSEDNHLLEEIEHLWQSRLEKPRPINL